MRHTILAGALLLAVAACGQETDPAEDVDVGTGPTGRDSPAADEGSPGAGQASPSAEEGSPGPEGGGASAEPAAFVLNRYGDEAGFADQRPTDYVATEFTTFQDMEWDTWTDTSARGEGEVSGTWCLDQDCSRDPYDIGIELGDPVEVDGTLYFSAYTVTEYGDDMPADMRAALEGSDDGRLAVPVEE
ncbi:hypothetical protein [Nocardiopsis sp. NRRL B-16309]|uniref:hypothetical protein n=1 Tax=Nocardiopsis sp. NRRL B-16309 TaxID=1519494 RepID=UPI0006AD98C5|nr:hypothetical protein [Nocardiopsis sp. NRRL B-16309]KOX13051.1 hypothetical protein ADL05_20215 [Nocardiopsis sp. NRRL B-16309]